MRLSGSTLFAPLLCVPLVFAPLGGVAQPAARDGSHDFDFNLGVWKTHIRSIRNPLSDSNAAVEFSGTVSVRKVWGGRAQLEEIEADDPRGHWEGMSLFLYNPSAHQWSQTFVDSDSGVFDVGTIGSFEGGRGELYAQDTAEGRAVLVRGVWSNIEPDSHDYQIAYSADGGQSWKPAFEAHLTRTGAAEAPEPPRASDSHDFDFFLGTWKVHTEHLLHPLSGAKAWTGLDGSAVVSKIWGGRASLSEYAASGPSGKVELLALHLYNPKARQWSMNFATPGVGTLGVPGIGTFRNGRGDFYDQEQFNGRSILVRVSIWSAGPGTVRSEQAFSDDFGKTWEVNWINTFTRAPS